MISTVCDFHEDFMNFDYNKILNAFFDGHPIKHFDFVDYNNIYIECSCGKKTILTKREVYDNLCEKQDLLERGFYTICKEGDNHKKFEYYSEELNKNLCDLCLKDKNLDVETLFNFDNHLYDYKIWGQEILSKFEQDEKGNDIIPPQIKDSFRLFWKVCKDNHHDYSFFSITKGFHDFCVANIKKEIDYKY